MAERILNIKTRVTEDRAANNRVLSDLERRVTAAVNPRQSNSQSLGVDRLANQATRGLQQTEKANQQQIVIQARLDADLRRIQARREADAEAHQQRLNEIALRGAQKRTVAVGAENRPTAGLTTNRLPATNTGGNEPARTTAATREAQQLLQARLRLLLADRDFAEAERQLAAAFERSTRGTIESINIERQLIAVRNQIAQAETRAAGQQQRQGDGEARRVIAQARLLASGRDFAGAERALQAQLAQTAQGTERAIRLESELASVRARSAREAQRAANRPTTITGRLSQPDIREAGESIQQSGQAIERFLTVPLVNAGKASVQSALDIDVFRTRLVALEGSAEKANARLDQLRKLALTSPGVTFQNAADQFALLKGTTDLLPTTIERVVKSIGRLNAAFKLENPQQFIRNIQQLFSQGFERQDFKEAIGQVPIFNQLLERAPGIGTADPERLRALKESGKLTAESFIQGLSQSIDTDPRLAGIQDNLAARFEKLSGRAKAALEPLGLSIINAISPAIEAAVPLIESLGSAFAGLPAPIQLSIIAVGGLTAAVGPALEAFGGIIQAFQVFRVATVIRGLTETVAALRLVQTTAAVTGVATVAMEAQLAAASTTIGATAAAGTASFAALGPIVLGAAAVIGVLALATTAEASAMDKAIGIAERHATVSTQQGAAIKSAQEALQLKTVSTQDLNRAVALLDPAEQAYVGTLKVQEEQIKRVTSALAEKTNAANQAAAAERTTTVQGLAEAAERAQALQAELKRLAEQYAVVEKNVATAGNSNRIFIAGMDEVRSEGDLARQALSALGSQLVATRDATKAADDKVVKIAQDLLLQAGSSEKATAEVQRLANSNIISAQQASIANAEIARLAAQTAAAGNSASGATGQVLDLANAIRQLGVAGARQKVAQSIEDAIKQANGNKSDALKLISAETRNLAKQANAAGKAQHEIEIALGLVDAPKRTRTGGAKAVNAVEDVRRTIARLKQEVEALERGGGPLFKFELDREELNSVKSQLTEILKLRRQLGENQNQALPRTEPGREAELRNLQREKQTRDEILKLADRSLEVQSRIRVETSKLSAPQATASESATLRLLEAANKEREDQLDLETRAVVLRRQVRLSEAENEQAAKRAAQAVTITAQERINVAGKELAVLVAVRNERERPAARQLEEKAFAVEAKTGRARAEEDAIQEIGRLNAQLREGLIADEIAIALFRTRANAQRVGDEQQTIARLRDLEDQLAAVRRGEGVDRAQSVVREQRLQGELTTAQQLAAIRAEDAAGLVRTEDFKRGVLERAELARRSAARSTADEIITLQSEIAHAAEGSADRYQAAYLRAIRSVQQEDESANQRLIENQIKLGRQSELRVDRLNDSLSNLLANQKGVTESFADFRANLAQDAFSGVERGVDALTKKFGVLGSAVSTLLKDLLKLAVSKIFQSLFGLNQQQQAPAGAGGFNLGSLLRLPAQGGSSGGGFNLGSLFGGGGGGFGGFTPGFAGGPGAGGILGGGGSAASSVSGANPLGSLFRIINPFGSSGASGGSGLFGGGGSASGGGGLFNGGGILNLLQRVPFLSRIFGGGAAGAARSIGGAAGNLNASAVASLFGGGSGSSAVAAGGIAGKLGINFGALGASGLLAGGGLLGTLAGGKSQTGRLLGGLGGTLGAGFLGSLGVFGSGVSAALPALLSNPITAIIAGGLIATALILNRRAKNDYRVYKPLILKEYALDVRSDKVLETVRDIGKQKFPKDYKQKRLETVRLEDTKSVLQSYAERTGQTGNNKLQGTALLDPNNPRNRFVVNPIGRINGGAIPAPVPNGRINAPTRGFDHIPLLADGGEYVINATRTARLGVRNLDELNAGRAKVLSAAAVVQQTRLIADLKRAAQRGGIFAPLFLRMAGNLARTLEGQPASRDRFVVSTPLPVRRLNGGFVAPRDRNAPTPSFTASDFFRSSEGQSYLRSFSTAPTTGTSGAPLSPSAARNDEQRGNQELLAELREMRRTNAQLAAALNHLESMPMGEMVGRGLRANPDAATDAVATGLRRRSNGALVIQDELGRGR